MTLLSFHEKHGAVRYLAVLALTVACGTEATPARPPGAAAPATSPAPADAPGAPKRLFARKFVARVRQGPSLESPQLGYLRHGAVLTAKTSRPIGFERCRRGWYEIAEPPGGFVCDGREVTAFEQGAALPDRQPTAADRGAPLPYRYAYSRGIGTPMYKRLPTEEEARFWEDGIIPADAGIPQELLVSLGLAGDAGVPQKARTLDELRGERGALVRRRMNPGFHVSLDREFDTGRRKYWRSLSNGYIPHARMVPVTGSSFQGIPNPSLPLAFVTSKDVVTQRENEKGQLVAAGVLPYHGAFAIASVREVKGRNYLVTPDGTLVRADQVVKVEPVPRPPGIGDSDRWLDLDLEHQTLVAYQGSSPAYATLVSTGRVRNEKNPQLNHETPAGRFRILSKHVSTTMDGDHAVFGAYSLEDVPYVQFFQGAYALHGAFWHDRFGRPASHGCINLAPEDARWLFDWTAPSVPTLWHAAYPPPTTHGTWLIIHGKTPRG